MCIFPVINNGVMNNLYIQSFTSLMTSLEKFPEVNDCIRKCVTTIETFFVYYNTLSKAVLGSQQLERKV